MTTSSAFSLRISKKSIRVLCHGGLQELLGFLHFLSSLFSEKPIGLPLPGQVFEERLVEKTFLQLLRECIARIA
ncbi:unnamed protein product, partial [Vitis vinifera]